ncbi:OTU-like cysteine protease [Nitzschia inconspicua]|uniref:OTU-like cysteine protease n=1 Tax=Nitzschia inconspicua TaxID=303405 RepID=A0A9K3LAX4_9STRA|nr:OTU-like cysteine protease [Nitzschia inconspicua]
MCRRHVRVVTVLALIFGIVGCVAITDASLTTVTAAASSCTNGSGSGSATTTIGAASATTSSSIPRSVERPSSLNGEPYSRRFPPWNPSPQIDADGFLIPKYRRVPGEWEWGSLPRRRKSKHLLSSSPPVTIRQVPGDGNCLFHSISTCYAHAVNGTHIDLRNADTMRWLYQHSTKLRQLAVDCLEGKRTNSNDDNDDNNDNQNNNNIKFRNNNKNNNRLLFLQGHEYLKSRDLVEAAASQYGISGEEYCRLMRQDSYWGGGPEIVALCNVLERPIHVYELHVPKMKKKKRKNKNKTTTTTTKSKQQTSSQSLFRRQKNANNNNNKDTDDTTNSGVGGDLSTKPVKDDDDDGNFNINNREEETTTTTSSSDSDDVPTRFVLRRMACFGSPKFDKYSPLHILSADSRFPDIEPGEQLSSGNHFLAIFPDDELLESKLSSKQRIRGGGGAAAAAGAAGGRMVENNDDDDDDDYEDYEFDDDDDDVNEPSGWWNRLWSLW